MTEIIIDDETKKLLDEMGFVEREPKDYQIEIKGGYAHVDFRKEDGRRWAKVGSAFVKDVNTIPILKAFKERRDEIKNKLLEGIGASQSPKGDTGRDKSTPEFLKEQIKTPLSNPAPVEREKPNFEEQQKIQPTTTLLSDSGVKIPPSPTSNKEQPLPPGASHSKSVFFDEIVPAYEIDICEFFGNPGTGKSQLAKQIALEAIARGKKVLYVDTERGFLKIDVKKLGTAYRYLSKMKRRDDKDQEDGILELVQKIPKDVDVFILDSVGYPVLTEWAKLGVNQKGDALTQIIAIKDYIKDWAINNNKIAIVINQPDSDFGKDKDYVNRPFGDKGQFVIKEVFYLKRAKASTTDKTIAVLESFRSRFEGRGTVVAQIEISGDGVKII